MDSYDPSKHDDYGVHKDIQSKIGGSSAGGATATTPEPSGWATSALADVFATTYDFDKITTYYPYASEATSTGSPGSNNNNNSNDEKKGGSSLPKWVAPVLGVVLGLVFVTGALVVFCLWHRRKIFRSRTSDYGTENSRIVSWLRGHPTEKAPTVTTSEDTPTSPDMEIARAVGTTPSNTNATSRPAEMADTQVAVELADTSPRVELQDTGLSPMEIIQKHSHFAETKTRSPTDPSYSSFTTGQDQASSISRPSGAPSAGAINPIGSDDTSARVASDVSGVSDMDAANLRRMSAGPVSPRSVSGEIPLKEKSADASPAMVSPALASPTPVSPPTAGEDTAQDYLSVKSTVSPLRKSIFKEHDDDEDDIGKEK